MGIGEAPGETLDDSLWWQHERLARLVFKDPQAHLPALQAQCRAQEQKWLASIPDSASAFKTHRALIQQWLDTGFADQTQDTRPWYVKRFWKGRNRAAGIE